MRVGGWGSNGLGVEDVARVISPRSLLFVVGHYFLRLWFDGEAQCLPPSFIKADMI